MAHSQEDREASDSRIWMRMARRTRAIGFGVRRARRLKGLAQLFLALLLLLLFVVGCSPAIKEPTVVDGRIDLTNWDFAKNGDVALVGTWEICWGQLLLPGDACPSAWRPFPVRGMWVEEEDSPFGGMGVTTYRLRIALAPGEEDLTLVAGAPHTSHRLFIDGIERGGAGVVGPSREISAMGVRNRVYNLTSPSGETEFLVQVANFEFRSGGLKRIWFLGLPDSIQQGMARAVVREGMVFAVGVVVGLTYLMLFALGPSEKARGYLGLFSLVIGLRSIAASITGFGGLIVPSASFELLTRFEYLGTAFVVVAAAGYAGTKTPGVVPLPLTRAIQLVAFALAAIVALAPFPIAFATLPLQYVLAVLSAGVLLVYYGSASFRGVRGTRVTAIAALIYLCVIVHDVVRTIHADFGARIELYPYAMVLWILVEGADLLRNFYQTFAKVESLSDELSEANFELSEAEAAIVRFVPFNFLRMLGKQSIRDVEVGDHVRARMSVLRCEAHLALSHEPGRGTKDSFGFVQQLVAAIEPLTHRHEGFMTELRADGFQAFFPVDASAAVAAGIELIETARRFNADAAAHGRVAIDVMVGIDTGPVLLETIGSQEHLLWGVVGEAVDGAGQVCSLASTRNAPLLISEATRVELAEPDRFETRRLHGATLGTAAGPVAVYEVRGLG